MQLRTQNVHLNSREVKRIYFEAFPKKERMPFPMMVAMSKLWNTQFLSFYDGDTLCGFVYLAKNRQVVFVMFFAVDQSLRSRGYGSAILQELRRRFPDKKIIITIEPCDEGACDLALRKRRKAFYLRNGYEQTGHFIRLSGVTQEIIITNGAFSRRQFRLFFAIYSNGTMWPRIWKQT